MDGFVARLTIRNVKRLLMKLCGSAAGVCVLVCLGVGVLCELRRLVTQ